MLYSVIVTLAMWSLCSAFRFSVSKVRMNSFQQSIRKYNYASRDTIYALSSGPVAKAGVSVIRISGPSSLFCLQSLCSNLSAIDNRPIKERCATLRKLYCPKTSDTLDQSLVLWFPGPHSFTGEDVVELHVHGSRAVISGVLGALEHLDTTTKKGIRPAERGEFTRRAFENGKMDLTGVEGLADLLDAQTAVQRKQALRQIDGHLTRTYDHWRSELVHCLAHTECVIDFGDDDREDDVTDDALEALTPRVTSLLKELEHHLHDGRKGEIVRDGVRIALAGPPNAATGKSSLLNALARRPAAIVSPIAGTTRDVVAVHLDLAGVPCIVSDTAGLRSDSSDLIELEGMNRARDAFRRAHIKLFVVDDSQEKKVVEESLNILKDVLQSKESEVDEDEDLGHEQGPVLIVRNKADLIATDGGSSSSGGDGGSDVMDAASTAAPALSISCRTGAGIPELEAALTREVEKLLGQGGGVGDSPIITRQRHRRHVQQSVDHLRRFLYLKLPVDLAAEELRFAMMELGKVTGVVDVEELLDVMFRDFCIGK